MTTHGIHHVTAVTARAGDNLRFYTQVLGLRLVKKTVNQDDISAYHLFYADAAGTPGTDMTFFDWEQAGPRQASNDEISRTLFRVNGRKALDYWVERLKSHGITDPRVTEMDGRGAILFEDIEGQLLGLVDDGGEDTEAVYWEKPGIPKAFALRGFYAAQLTVPLLGLVDPILTKILQWEHMGTYIDPVTSHEMHRYGMAGGGPGREVHVRELPESMPRYGSTAGSVHHMAFRLRDEKEMADWLEYFERLGLMNSGVIDRYYFKALYFRITQGILFELSTDGPGFATDEDPQLLGEALSLPPFLEHRRAEIEAGLKPL